MQLSVKNNAVVIEASGIELLRLKSELKIRLGNALEVRGSIMTFPVAALSFVEDLLGEAVLDDQVKDCHLRFERHAAATKEITAIIEACDASGVPKDWLGVLDPAQASAVKAMTQDGLLGLCLFDEQGSGKTVMTVSALDVLIDRDEIDAVIVVCPKTMISEWQSDIEKFLPEKFNVVLAEGDKHKKYTVAWDDFDVLITNYEGVGQMLSALSAKAEVNRFLLVVDESYYVKNKESRRSAAVEGLRSVCKKCFVLCGTPAPNSPYDLIHQFNLADEGYTFSSFTKGRDEDQDRIKIENLIDLRGALVRRLKTDILSEVPDKNFHVIALPLKGRQAILYEKAKTELVMELRSLSNTTFRKYLNTYFQRRSALLQICSNPLAIDPTITDTPVKYDYLDTLLRDLTSQGRKVIVWSFYKQSLDEMSARYTDYNPVRIDGSVKALDRRAAVENFQNDPSVQLFLGNPAAAGAGVTLHASYDAVYISYSSQAAHYLQSLDRIHRRGQTEDHVNYYLIVCENTIEEAEVRRLRDKELQQHSLLGDHVVWPASLDEALSELTGS